MKLLTAIALAAALAGCAPTKHAAKEPAESQAASTADVVGKWTGNFVPGPKDLKGSTPEQEQQAKETFAQMKIELDVREDGTYTMTGMDSSDGTWQIKDGDLVISDGNARETDPFKDQKMELQEGGKKLVGRDPTGESDSELVFTRG